MNVFVTSLLKIINNPDIQDTNYNIAYYILENYYEISQMTLQEIADACYVSVSTLNRFFRIFGLKKFSIIKDLMTLHATARISQLEERAAHKNNEQVDYLLKLVLKDQDYQFVVSEKLIQQCCQIIDQCQRVVLIGSNEMMDSLLRFQGDMAMMKKLVIQNTIYNNNFIEPRKSDLVILLSMTGRIAELKPSLIEKLMKSQNHLICVGYKNFLNDRALFLKIPNYLDEALENMILDNYFQNIAYQYCEDYYDFK